MKSYQESDCCYCTLFNSFYLDRGVTMLHSVIENCGEARIYVLAMDDHTFRVLSEMALEKTVVIHYDDFVTDELRAVQSERTIAEYCWTCTAPLVAYILNEYQEKVCTYIDADLFFYKNPYCLVKEMLDEGYSVQIVEHRFGKGIFAEHMRKYSGTFCVQFNTFKNNREAKEILKEWAVQCLECCTSVQDRNNLGDQKYLEKWPETYSCVHVLRNEGGGLAPWNIHQYHLESEEEGNIQIKNKKNKNIEYLIFYHFHELQFLGQGRADIHVFTRNFGIERELIEFLYLPYIRRVQGVREYLLHNFPEPTEQNQQRILPTKPQKAKREIFGEDFWEKVYCKLRGVVLKMQRKKDFLEI